MKSGSRPSANAASASRLAGPPISSAKPAFSRSRAAAIPARQRLDHRPLHRDQAGDRLGGQHLGVPAGLGQQRRRARRPARPAPSPAPRRRRPTPRTGSSQAAFWRPDQQRQQVRRRGLGRDPEEVNGHLSRASVDMKARSAKPRMVQPMPRPIPLTATTSGLGNASSASTSPRKPCLPAHEVGSVAMRCISSRSVPAENARPLPVSSTTATPGRRPPRAAPPPARRTAPR